MLGIWAGVVRHLPLGQATQDGAGQGLLNEEVFLEDHRFSGLRAQGLEDRADGLGHLVPREWPHGGLHVCKTLHRVAVAVSPVEAEGRSPVVDDEGDPLMHTECREQGVDVAAVLNKGVRAGAAGRELVGVAHADEVGRDTVPALLEVRDHIAPEIRRRGVAVEEDDRVALAHLHIRHLTTEDPPPLLLVRKCRRDPHSAVWIDPKARSLVGWTPCPAQPYLSGMGRTLGDLMASRYVVEHLHHLGIVAEVCREIGVADWLDQKEPGNRQQGRFGTATVALVLNGLGFSNRRLYLVPQFFADKPVEHLLGPGIMAEDLNDDCLGRTLDWLYAQDVTRLFAGLALRARRAFGVGAARLHVDTTSFSVHGQYAQAAAPPVGADRG